MKDLLIDRLPMAPDITRGRVELHSTTAPDVQSQALDWPGLLAEAGRNQVATVERIALAHHYVGMNAGTEQVRFRGAGWYGGDWRVRDVSIWSLADPAAG